MTTTLCIFEDGQYANLLPLTALRPVWDIRCGILTLGQKIEHAWPGAKVRLFCRSYLAPLVQEEHTERPVNAPAPAACLFVNGRVIANTELARHIPPEGPDTVFVHNHSIVAVRASEHTVRSLKTDAEGLLDLAALTGLPRVNVACTLIRYPWDVVNANGMQIADDAALLATNAPHLEGVKVYDGTHLVNPEAISAGRGSIIKPGVVLDADKGPIVIGANVRIYPNAVIEGPAFIGGGSIIKIGAKIYENTTIGPMCKVGGEVEGSILHGFVNKQHEGFLGHAYLCPWSNLGADTNNSDLKNNYSSVRVTINGTEVDSGSLFAGLFMGDHAKSAINTMFNTGTVVGVGSNVFGAGFPPKYIPAFSWGGAEGLEPYTVEKCLEVARKVMLRRNQTLTPTAEAVLRHIFTMTQNERGR
jgi:UDP-N-acetylglucosamine diphosphorylase / glucose-1-phosphate thymidylyltransferase / UDP-N-acetylgalactosamine diphosphorylase / glucosamine-1-phosphate N-acetyltransferase / galactosamine-1-phosphate N-acetyltransferase